MNLQDKLKYLKEVAREANEIGREDEFRSLIDALEIAVSALESVECFEPTTKGGGICDNAIEQIKTKLGCV